MKNPFEVLYNKEAELTRVRREIESLKITASLLADDELSLFIADNVPDGQNKKPVMRAISAQTTGPEGKPWIWPGSAFWSSLKRRR
jgi:hypothetical protein